MMFPDKGNYRTSKRCTRRRCIAPRWKPNRLCDLTFLGESEGLVNIGDTKGILEGGDGTPGSLIEECVDSGDSKAFLKHGHGLADGLDGSWRSTLLREAKKVLGKSDTQLVLKLKELLVIFQTPRDRCNVWLRRPVSSIPSSGSCRGGRQA